MIRRLSSLMVALWFALYVGAPQLLHPCPQHAVHGAWNVAAGAEQATAQHASALPEAAAHAAHHASGPTQSPSSALQSDGDSHSQHSSGPEGEHDCCCPGPQCGSAAVVVAVDTPSVSVTIVDAAVSVAAPPLVPAASRVAHTLPYATAPPVTASA